jgi:DNA primase
MAFDPAFLDALRDALPVAEVVGQRVALKKKGREYLGLCPFHKEKTPSFTVNEEKRFFHCFGCGAHGDVIGFVMRSEGLSFPEAVAKLAGLANLALPERGPAERAAAAHRSDLRETLELACAWFEEQLAGPPGVAARAYLAGRGLTPATQRQFRLGFAPSQRGALRLALNAKGIDDGLQIDAGLLKPADDNRPLRDHFFDRVIFPITDRAGHSVGFGGRALASEAKAKYINSPDGPVFHKGRLLYNLHRARQAAHDTGELIVAEGYMDVIAMAQAGFQAAVAPLGTAITEDQITGLWRLASEPVLCFDGDEAGQRAALRAAERALPLLVPDRSLRFASLPSGEDPDSLLRGFGASALRRVLDQALPLVEVLWQGRAAGRRFDTPERRAALRQDLLREIERIADAGVREAYRSDVLSRYDALFGRARRGSGGGRSSRSQAPGRFLPGVATALRRPPPDLLRQRPEQVLLAMAINHPRLIGEQAEELAAVRLATPQADRLRAELVDHAARVPDLDSAALKCHLCETGFAALVEQVLSAAVYQHEPLARPEAPAAEVGKRFGYWVIRVREGGGRPDRDEAVQRLAEETSDAQLDRVRAERALAEETTAQQRVIERFEPLDPND